VSYPGCLPTRLWLSKYLPPPSTKILVLLSSKRRIVVSTWRDLKGQPLNTGTDTATHWQLILQVECGWWGFCTILQLVIMVKQATATGRWRSKVGKGWEQS
jgi:hypothetical protein